MDHVLFISFALQLFLGVQACIVLYKTSALPGCEQDLVPLVPAYNSSTVTYGTECFLLCRNDKKCHGISICPDSEDQGLSSCGLHGRTTDGTCGNLTLAAGCRDLEFEVVPNGPQCVPPRIFDEEEEECQCEPFWMTDPNCDQYYIDCSEAFSAGLRVPGDMLTMFIKPRISPAPFKVECYLDWGGYTYIQRRFSSCPDDLIGLNWADFIGGFGELNCSYYLGLGKLHQLLQNGVFFLNIEMVGGAFTENAYYTGFNVGDESTNYTVDWDSFSGKEPFVGNGFVYGGAGFTAKGSHFATNDRDVNGCATAQGTGWWYNENCTYVNLNLPLNTPPAPGSLGSAAWSAHGTLTSLDRFLFKHLLTSR